MTVTFYRDSVLGDVDNLTKPVLDALQGVAYINDRQVSDVSAGRRDINGRFRVGHQDTPPPHSAEQECAELSSLCEDRHAQVRKAAASVQDVQYRMGEIGGVSVAVAKLAAF
jgi:hypothetical protein